MQHFNKQHPQQHRNAGKTAAVQIHRGDYGIDPYSKKEITSEYERYSLKYMFTLYSCIDS